MKYQWAAVALAILVSTSACTDRLLSTAKLAGEVKGVRVISEALIPAPNTNHHPIHVAQIEFSDGERCVVVDDGQGVGVDCHR